MNIKSGDYVNYSAGNWTKKEIETMGNLYSGENIPDSTKPYTFGGFKIGQSKDAGITKSEDNKAILDTEHSGWRVLSINNDGSVKIIHAGTPEYYYHPTRTYDGKLAMSSYRSKYILGGEEDENADEETFENATVKDWKAYEDEKFAIGGSAHLINKDDLGYRGPTGVWYRKCQFSYWVYLFYPSAGGIFVNTGSNGSTNNYLRSVSLGIRPVLTIKSGVLFHNTTDEETHDTPNTAWNLIL